MALTWAYDLLFTFRLTDSGLSVNVGPLILVPAAMIYSLKVLAPMIKSQAPKPAVKVVTKKLRATAPDGLNIWETLRDDAPSLREFANGEVFELMSWGAVNGRYTIVSVRDQSGKVITGWMKLSEYTEEV